MDTLNTDLAMKYGGHRAECEGSCVDGCPIGDERRRLANIRAAQAQAAWDAANAHDSRIAADLEDRAHGRRRA